ncbi:hypothetical protein JTF06_08575 [Desemzia sp. RIT804]|uniref:hypothetical protein n=1 Tax=Desemzia sp. RIT 804 TaxID=2810209 RepID=UPI00194FE5AA|nr:hypothetical protein [Desemzia sp. RIT 804]MBM6614944.1 hypothetical protein [Desemzia sp. RIT 804]
MTTPNSLEIFSVVSGEQTEADFLQFPQRIYKKDELMQSISEKQAQISGQHPLSPAYTFQAFNGYQEGQMVIRGALIKPHHLEDYYLGYFEAVDDVTIMTQFINILSEKVREKNGKRVVGPVQGSFWLGYRMKVKGFERTPFTSEPHNPAYYPKLWQAAGFKEIEHYTSNFYHSIPPQYESTKLAKRYQSFVEKGYRFISPKREDWSTVSLEVFDLLSTLYKDFPLYQKVTAEQFTHIFADLKQVIDFSMVKLAYKDQQLVGFLITLPDYGNLIYRKMTMLNLAKILYKRWRAKRYIILYLGVDPNHLGLGLAMSYPVFRQVKQRKAEIVGALIHEKTVTDRYVTEMQKDSHAYSLWMLELE